ncbi:MAG: PAS domain S-box-containing protein/diguanylate cyclase (GGDEF) domain-containing protein [Candidatus Electronema aureum]|uniref:PAS domain S-box-containing protein/diguanylate cyclase (GGDEF) domain-containing protein n=1 Tax=Candidatus Electronema aureum TaxID=2005002 RepID=A0A521G2C6_9BACT|nr:MAG: PAS domain S-box-containing protein/diguanylate cyclase (GGDEF) domain-containing protein [Candidatus Electronema aureum]
MKRLVTPEPAAVPDRSVDETPSYILIVDDRHSDLRLLEAILKGHGYRSLSLTNPTKVLKQCHSEPPEIILLDISMPELDGFQVCAQLKADPQLADIPVLFLTAMRDVANRIRGFKAGGSDFLIKPYEPSELIARVSTHIKLRKIQLELAGRNQELKEKISDLERTHAALLKSEARTEAVLNNAGVCIGVLDVGCTYQKVNGMYAQIFGYTPEEFRSMRLWDILHPDFADQAQETVARLRGGELEQHYADKVFVRKDGTQFPGGHWLSPQRDSDGRCSGFVCVISDLTKQKEAEYKLRLAHTVFETSSEGMLVTDANNCIIMVNPAFTAITGYRSEEVIGRQPSFQHSERHDQEFYHQMWDELLVNGRWQGEIWNCRQNGDIYPLWLSIALIRNQEGSIVNHVALFCDISERKKAEEILRYQAMHDPLTKLPNRAMFDERLRGALSRAKRKKKLVALLYLDLDNFKTVNDTLGHLAGDRFLQLVAETMQSCLRAEDMAARLGGDEFCAILEDVSSISQATGIAERIITELGSLDCFPDGCGLRTSIGIAVYPNHGIDAESLLRCADHAMYTAKRLGKGRCQMA